MKCVLAVLVLACVAEGHDPCTSGPAVGQRPGPYSFLIATGANRGKSHCYVCETADKPAVIVFARSHSEPLGKLLVSVDKALQAHKEKDLRAWATFLHDDQPGQDAKLATWARQHGIGNLPVGIFEDKDGPPSYRLNRDADVTILLSVGQKVVANFAFRSGELNEAKAKEVLDALPKILK